MLINKNRSLLLLSLKPADVFKSFIFKALAALSAHILYTYNPFEISIELMYFVCMSFLHLIFVSHFSEKRKEKSAQKHFRLQKCLSRKSDTHYVYEDSLECSQAADWAEGENI